MRSLWPYRLTAVSLCNKICCIVTLMEAMAAKDSVEATTAMAFRAAMAWEPAMDSAVDMVIRLLTWPAIVVTDSMLFLKSRSSKSAIRDRIKSKSDAERRKDRRKIRMPRVSKYWILRFQGIALHMLKTKTMQLVSKDKTSTVYRPTTMVAMVATAWTLSMDTAA